MTPPLCNVLANLVCFYRSSDGFQPAF